MSDFRQNDNGQFQMITNREERLMFDRDRLQRELDAATQIISRVQAERDDTERHMNAERDRAEKAEALAETHRLERELQSERIATLIEERDAANRRSDSWQAAYEGQTRLEADNARLRAALEPFAKAVTSALERKDVLLDDTSKLLLDQWTAYGRGVSVATKDFLNARAALIESTQDATITKLEFKIEQK